MTWREIHLGQIPLIPLREERVMVSLLSADAVMARLSSFTQPRKWSTLLAGPGVGMRFYGHVQKSAFSLWLFDPKWNYQPSTRLRGSTTATEVGAEIALTFTNSATWLMDGAGAALAVASATAGTWEMAALTFCVIPIFHLLNCYLYHLDRTRTEQYLLSLWDAQIVEQT